MLGTVAGHHAVARGDASGPPTTSPGTRCSACSRPAPTRSARCRSSRAGRRSGVTFQAPDADRYGYSAKYLRGRIIGALGGRAAEEIVYADVTTGAESDLDQVSQHRPADGRPLGHVGRGRPGHRAPAAGAGVAAGPRRRRARRRKELVDREVRRIVDECYDEAVATLVAHRDQLDRLAHALLAQETLDEDEAYAAAGVPAGAGARCARPRRRPRRPASTGLPPQPAPTGDPASLGRCRHESTLARARRAAHGLGPAPGRGQAAVVRRRDRVAQLAAADAGRPARQGRPGRLLDLHLHQLAAHAALRPRLGREVQGPRAGGDRRAHAGVPVRARRSTTSAGPCRTCGSTIPVAIDNDYAVWRAFDNHYWPALYFVDAQGRIRHHHFGEGEYEQSEMVIQQLLAEAGLRSPAATWSRSTPAASKPPADWASLSHRRTTSATSAPRASRRPAASGRTGRTSTPPGAAAAQPVGAGRRLDGRGAGQPRSNEADGRIAYRFHARDLQPRHGAGRAGNARCGSACCIDGQPPGAAHGGDVDAEGNGTVTEQRLYQLIRQPRSDHRSPPSRSSSSTPASRRSRSRSADQPSHTRTPRMIAHCTG